MEKFTIHNAAILVVATHSLTQQFQVCAEQRRLLLRFWCGVKAIIVVLACVDDRGQNKTSVDFDCWSIDFPCCAHIFKSTQTDWHGWQCMGLVRRLYGGLYEPHVTEKGTKTNQKKKKRKIDAIGNRCVSRYFMLYIKLKMCFYFPSLKQTLLRFGRKSVVSISHFTSALNGNSNTKKNTRTQLLSGTS